MLDQQEKLVGEGISFFKMLKGHHHSVESIEKLKKSLIGNKNHFGKKHSEESKLKMSKSLKGRSVWNKNFVGEKYLSHYKDKKVWNKGKKGLQIAWNKGTAKKKLEKFRFNRSMILYCDNCSLPTRVNSSAIKNKPKHFCSRSCCDRYYKSIEYKRCPICLNLFFKPRWQLTKAKYCSHKCSVKDHSLEKHPNWVGGKSFEPYNSVFNEEFKDRIRSRDGYICSLCLIPESLTGYKLDIHHIDYDKKNSCPENCIGLCHFCHPTTNKNRGYWKDIFYSLLKIKYNYKEIL